MKIENMRLSWLDFKVGFRMLAKYPGLTLVGTVAIAVAVALGALYFEGVGKVVNPRVPGPQGERLVSIRNWDVSSVSAEERLLHDFATWRQQVKTVEDLGAALTFVRNLATDDGRIEPVRGAEVTSSAFTLLGTAPLLGRALTRQDEQASAPPVVVIGETVWRSRFDSDPGVVGRTVRVGTATVTIIGVMPERFGLPIRERLWMPLRVNASATAPRTGPRISVFGRLAAGATLNDARAEFDAIAGRLAAANPATHRNLKARVTGYGKPLTEAGQALVIKNVLYLVNIVFLLLLSIICANVATLVFARSATRGWEIAVRSVLGASRGRIMTQLFIEALVLSALGAAFGLLLAKVGLRLGLNLLAGTDALPFWVDASLSWATIGYAALLTLVGAAIVGILPALRVTRLNVQDALRCESGAGAGLRFGGFWTAVIVAQVAITVAFLPLAAGGVFESNRFRQRAEGIGAERYLTARIDVDPEDHAADAGTFSARARHSLDELERRLIAEPGVEQVAFADRLPVMDQFKYTIEVDPAGGAPTTALRTSTLVQVSRGFFAAFGTSVLAGRDFAPLDFESGRVLIVNQSFARHVLGGRNPVGQRVRIVDGEDDRVVGEQWYEVVGMVKDFGWQLPLPHEQSAIYRPRLPAPGADISLAVRVGDPEAFATRLRALVAGVDRTIRLTEVQPLAQVGGGEARMNWALTGVAWLVSFIVLLLSATGIHSLMSFTVTRRTREIGIRAALGARPGRILAGIFSRAALQVGVGILVGSACAALWGLGTRELLLLLAADVVMLVVGLAACLVPVRRALRIDPTEALRADG